MVQRYENESKSQLTSEVSSGHRCCFQWFKDTKMKANHNALILALCVFSAVSNGSKIQK